MSHSPSIVVVNGRALVRATLAAWLRAHGFETGIVAANSDAANECARLAPGVVILNVGPGDGRPEEAARCIRARLPNTPIVAIVDPSLGTSTQALLASSTTNLFSTNEPPEQLAAALRLVASGESYQSPGLSSSGWWDRAGHGNCKERCPPLTPREIEILRHLAQGLSKRQIAESIHLSIKTVDNHCTSIMAKLNIHNRVELARYAIREGLAQA